MIIFMNSLKRILKSKAQIAIMLILPLLPIIPIAFGSSIHAKPIDLGFIDNDNTKLTAALIKDMKSECNIIHIKKKDIENSLINSKVNYVIEIDKGFSYGIINGKDMRVRGYAKKEANLSPLVKSCVDKFLNPAKEIASVSNGDSKNFYLKLKRYSQSNIKAISHFVKGKDKFQARSAWGMVLQFMLFSSILASTLILTDKENKTFFRSLFAPIRLKNYMLQSILAFFVVAVIQVIFLMFVIVYVFGIYPGVSILNMIALMTAFALTTVAMGIAISALSKSVVQAALIGVSSTIAMCMIGGAWAVDASSEIVKGIAKCTPVWWAMEATKKLINDKGIYSIAGEIGILMLFAVVFFLMGTWRKSDIAQ